MRKFSRHLFPALVRDKGLRYWHCPACGHWQTSKLWRGRWKFRCKDDHCHRVWAIGYKFWPLNPGRQRVPKDMLIPDWSKMSKPAFLTAEVARVPYDNDSVNEIMEEPE